MPALFDVYDHCAFALSLVESPTQYRAFAANDTGDATETFQTLAVPLRLESLDRPDRRDDIARHDGTSTERARVVDADRRRA